MTDHQGRRIVDNSASGKSTVGCFGALREKEGKTGWQSPRKTSQVDLRF
jgi:hypothetical protein